MWRELPPSNEKTVQKNTTKEPPEINLAAQNTHAAQASVTQKADSAKHELSNRKTSHSSKKPLKRLGNPLFITKIVLTAIFVLFIVTFFSAQNFIVKNWPEMQKIYFSFGMAGNPFDGNLMLQNITSERRYMDGAMRLYVQGEILSKAKKMQVIPSVIVEAIGPDDRVIESWRIAPPQVTIRPGASVPFSSSILSPEGTVVEVNLSFSELTEDE